jgi:hypothetical protein
MKGSKAIVLTALLVIFLSLSFLAPIVYGFHRTTPPGVNVKFYESPSCQLLGIGALYVYGQSIGGNGQTVGVSNYQWMTQGCNMVP